jgi:hypothetical protein
MISIYEEAAPIPNEMPEKETNDFLFELRELLRNAIINGGGQIRGWTRENQ